MMDRRIFLAGASALALSVPLAGCGGNLIGPPDAGPIYVLRPNFPPAPAGGAKVNWALAVLRPDLPGALNSDRIALDQPDGTMDYFAKATYPDQLAAIIQHAMVEGFEASGRIEKVAREEDALHADYDLVLEVSDFEAKYSQPDGIPAAKVTIVAKLATAHGRDIVGTFTSSPGGTASANSAAAATQALQQALGTAITQIVNWALAFPPPSSQQMQTVSPGKPAEELLHQTRRGSQKLRDSVPAGSAQ
jgi:ABC-type uncharacterized transport system auxiliary subunit